VTLRYGPLPNFGDINSIVQKFSNLASAPSMPRADLVGTGNPGQPSTPNQVANFADISNDVSAFSGFLVPVHRCRRVHRLTTARTLRRHESSHRPKDTGVGNYRTTTATRKEGVTDQSLQHVQFTRGVLSDARLC